MAKRIENGLKLRLKYDNGMKGDKQIYRSKTYANIDVKASDDQVFSLGNEIAGLSSKDLLAIERLDQALLVDEVAQA